MGNASSAHTKPKPDANGTTTAAGAVSTTAGTGPAAPSTSDPNEWWKLHGKHSPIVKPSALVHLTPNGDAPAPKWPHRPFVRVCVISDTHNQAHRLTLPPPGECDVLLHCGDFTNTGTRDELVAFNNWLGSSDVKSRFAFRPIVIAGNHELSLDATSWTDNYYRFCTFQDADTATAPAPSAGSKSKAAKVETRAPPPFSAADARQILTNCTLLFDNSATLSTPPGLTATPPIEPITIWGSPYTPVYQDWAFNLPRGEASAKQWAKIPENVDILMTHGPPIGHGDLMRDQNGARSGCVDLWRRITEMKRPPPIHVFGHVHEGYGVTTNGVTTFINASSVGGRGLNPPIIFDFPPPPRPTATTAATATAAATAATVTATTATAATTTIALSPTPTASLAAQP